MSIYYFNQLVDILDERGQPTDKQARYNGPLVKGAQETGQHIVTLCAPAQGCPAIPTAQLRAARETTGRAVRTPGKAGGAARRGQPRTPHTENMKRAGQPQEEAA